MNIIFKIGYFLGNNFIYLVFLLFGIVLLIITEFNINIYYLIALSILYIIIIVVCKSKPDYKKYVTQCLIFLIEILICVGFFIYLSTFLLPIQNNLDLIQRFILFFTLYQIIVYCTLNFINDAQKDAYNTFRLLYEQGLLYFEILQIDSENADKYKSILFKHINLQLSESILNTEEVKDKYEKLKEYIKDENIIAIKMELIQINHWLTHLDLKFMFSFLLRITKTGLDLSKEK